MMWTSGMGPGMWLLMAAGILGFWVLIAMLVRAIFSNPARGGEPTVDRSPLHVLADRLARGEITPEEYEQRRRALTDLTASADPPAPGVGLQSSVSVPDPTKDHHRSS
ncbi:membrane protein [Intrasporangium chromatireducens Q5-1]|uniref:Membrane protein n=1 Tax=Intrasporangium chromatireducens Q5-1 TaxID=584657 RepID=W9GNQ3_9MICO|nr:SHOCT domain-containing protein [Intrasporangium chromatireducens]EWT07755.1 membrane protein [Intrasporangium chromatireducens Q5-1]